MNRIHRIAVTVSFLLAAAAVASAADLTVTVKDVRNTTGSVLIVVYDEGSFGKPELAKAKQKANATQGEVNKVTTLAIRPGSIITEWRDSHVDKTWMGLKEFFLT